MDEVTREVFRALVKEWDEWQEGCSAPMDQRSPAYPKTIKMGESIVPLILAELTHQPHWWMLQALAEITHESPWPHEHEGRFLELIADWLQWGRQKGHLPAES